MTVEPLTLQGTRVRLRPLREEDVAPLTAWFNDPDVRYWLHHSEREDATEADFREVYMRRGDSTVLALAIEAEGEQLIGVTRLIGIDRTHGRAELTIVIGDRSAWGCGYGTEAMRLLLRHAFEEMGLRRVELITDADNARAIRAYEKCGFVREGVLRQHRLRHGEPLDMVVMGVLREQEAWRKEEEDGR